MAGQRKAICIGINDYPRKPLHGCVADARAWDGWFRSAGFNVEDPLLNSDATRSAIEKVVRDIVRSAEDGDIVAIQYSGHGTQLPGGSDEPDDEAIVPIDHRQAGYIIDDFIASVLDGVSSSASIYFFLDCCHSGTMTRELGRGVPEVPNDYVARQLVADPEMKAAHAEHPPFRDADVRSRGSYDDAKEVLFSACQSKQLSYESGGQGHFTKAALNLLNSSDISSLTNRTFTDKVRGRMPNLSKQNPGLYTKESNYNRPFLGGSSPDGSTGPSAQLPDDDAAILEMIHQLQAEGEKIRTEQEDRISDSAAARKELEELLKKLKGGN